MSQKSHKIAKIFWCETCNYKCCNKYDYNKHLLTTKHKMIINDNNKSHKIATSYSCECGKLYKHASGLSRHKLQCNQNDDSNATTNIVETINDNSTILNLITQNKELMNMLTVQNQEHREETSKLQNTIHEMIPKIGNNNTNTTNNNTQFNLQVFLNEECKDALNFSDFVETIKVSFGDLENQAENGYVKGISKLFIESLERLGVNMRPIHCTDKKRKTLYIKENNAWDKEGSQDMIKNGIKEVSRRTFAELIKSKEDNAVEYRDGDSEFSQKCITIQRNLVPTHPRETAIGKVIENITQNTGILEK